MAKAIFKYHNVSNKSNFKKTLKNFVLNFSFSYLRFKIKIKQQQTLDVNTCTCNNARCSTK